MAIFFREVSRLLVSDGGLNEFDTESLGFGAGHRDQSSTRRREPAIAGITTRATSANGTHPIDRVDRVARTAALTLAYAYHAAGSGQPRRAAQFFGAAASVAAGAGADDRGPHAPSLAEAREWRPELWERRSSELNLRRANA